MVVCADIRGSDDLGFEMSEINSLDCLCVCCD